jgi:Rrf2 family iron-sulfur cluster assembly transcriptional regulator
VAALVDLAQSQSRRPVALADIAQRQAVSVSYLEQVFALLRINGFVKSVRGPGGGYLLSRTPDEIRVSDVFTSFAASQAAADGDRDHDDVARGNTLTAKLWDTLDAETMRFLSNVTIRNVVDGAIGVSRPVRHAQAAE